MIFLFCKKGFSVEGGKKKLRLKIYRKICILIKAVIWGYRFTS